MLVLHTNIFHILGEALVALVLFALVLTALVVLITLVHIALVLVALAMSSSGADFMSDNIICANCRPQ